MNAILRPEFTWSLLVFQWKQHLRHQSNVPACPWLKGSKSSANMGSHETHTAHEHTPRWISPEEQSLVASLPLAVLQSYLPWAQIRITVKKRNGASSPPTRSIPHLWQGSDNHRAKGEAPLNIQGRLLIDPAIKAEIKGIRVQVYGPTSPPSGKTIEQEEIGSWSLQNRPQTQKMWQNE